jgi:hypothetical protein
LQSQKKIEQKNAPKSRIQARRMSSEASVAEVKKDLKEVIEG